LFSAQIETLLKDVRPGAIKTGMLLTHRAVVTVARAIREHRIENVVVDPVIRSSTGSILLSPTGVVRMKKELLPLTSIVTPNINEAEILSGRRISSEKDMDYAAGVILNLGPRYVLIKGGHRRGPAADTLYGGRTVLTFSTSRQKGEFHGTGCALSSAVAVWIARGLSVEKAVEKAKELVDSLLRKAKSVGRGRTKYFQF
jgi:hydroxymethylpyrimidine/phosphomethylpyrimidine kinase